MPLIEGRVQPEDIHLTVTPIADDVERQSRARAGEFDICEFYAGLYLSDLLYGSLGFTAIPIYVKRMFRHSYIYINRRAGIQDPRDLNGKRIGVQTWFTTTALWGRGILAEDHGLDLRSVHWVIGRNDAVGGWEPPPWLRYSIAKSGPSDVVGTHGGTKGESLHQMLVAGEIEAAIVTRPWSPGGHPDVTFLFPDYPSREREYFQRTRIFPIMHFLLIRTSILEEHPWVAMSLFNAWQQSKELCYDWLDRQRMHLTALWYRGLWEEERQATGTRDIYRWGFKESRYELQKLCQYAFDQGLTTRLLNPEELFHPSTLNT